MQIWGKVFGFIAGFMLLNIVGALIGLYIGHRFDVGYSQDFNARGGFEGMFSSNNKSSEAAFFYTTFAVMGHIAKANGRVTESEIALANALMDRIGLTGEHRREAQEAFRDGKTAGFPLEANLTTFRNACRGRHDLLQMFVEVQIQAALADGDLDRPEREILEAVAKALGFTKFILNQLIEMHKAQQRFYQRRASHGQVDETKQLQDAYSLLGVSSTSSDKDIKRAHRKLMSQHHPDKLVAKGLPAEMMEMAKQKAQSIQAAYDLIQSKRG